MTVLRTGRLVGSVTIGTALLSSSVPIVESFSLSGPPPLPLAGQLRTSGRMGIDGRSGTSIHIVVDRAPSGAGRIASVLVPGEGGFAKGVLPFPAFGQPQTLPPPHLPLVETEAARAVPNMPVPDASFLVAAPFGVPSLASMYPLPSPLVPSLGEQVAARDPMPLPDGAERQSLAAGPDAPHWQNDLTFRDPRLSDRLPSATLFVPPDPAPGLSARLGQAPEAAPATPTSDGRPEPVAALPSVAGGGDASAADPKIARLTTPGAGSIAPVPTSEPHPTALSAGGMTVPSHAGTGRPAISYDDELILQIQVRGAPGNDTIVAYGTRSGVYLPLGELARILDLAIVVSDDGHYASGWFLSEDRRLTINLRQNELTLNNQQLALPPDLAQPFEGEMFVEAEALGMLFPLQVVPDLRAQAVLITTLEPFPFEERMRRDAERSRLAGRSENAEGDRWARQETPWVPLSYPLSDVELRAQADRSRGTRGEIDLRMSGDLAWMTAQTYLAATSRDGLVGALVELGRRDADGDLLGPLQATEFRFGDVATTAMPLGLRGAVGRGGYVTNQPIENGTVFDRIDLRGVLPDGYEVELYRNDILLASTRASINGQYEFLQVPLDYGLNVLRIVFYGPQGQRREEVRRLNVGDGRLGPGQLQYSVGAVQRAINLLGVHGPDFQPPARFGDWQATAEISYGLSRYLTLEGSTAVYEDLGRGRWLATGGVRTGLGSLAFRGDIGLSSSGGQAYNLSVSGRLPGGAFVLSHSEYGGLFDDEVRSISGDLLTRATEVDLNTSVSVGRLGIPLSIRARHLVFRDGQSQASASLRGSMRVPGAIVSGTWDYVRTTSPGVPDFNQLVGSFDLGTFSRSRTQMRASLIYRLVPDVALTVVGAEIDHRLGDGLVLRASGSYSLADHGLTVSSSAVKEFSRFTLALDGQVSLKTQVYSVAFRIGFSFGRDPVQSRWFIASPGASSSGAAALRAFHDVDGDQVFTSADRPVPAAEFIAFNLTSTADEDGLARLTGLSNGTRVSLQLDPASLPDILMAPVTRGIEIVPRAGRFHVADFPIVNLGEIEGVVNFADDAVARGVSGLRIGLQNARGEIEEWTRTERGGYFFYERARPGRYHLILDPEQAQRLGICLTAPVELTVGPEGDVARADFAVIRC